MRTFIQKPKASQQTTSAKPTIPSRAHFGESREVNSILHLQRTIGNQAVQPMLQTNAEELEAGLASTASPHFAHDFSQIPVHPKSPAGVQAKLTVGPPGDIYEQEADRASEQVMATPADAAVRGVPHIQRFSGESTGLIVRAPASVDQALASPGRPLEPALRRDMERRFACDFSRVRLHTGEAAEQSAYDVNAKAYTWGHDVVFGKGWFAPETHHGRRLIAHELTHVVQQTDPEGMAQSGLMAIQPPPANRAVSRALRTLSIQRETAQTVDNDKWRRVVDGYNSLLWDIGMVNQKVNSPTRTEWVNDLAATVGQIGGPGDVDVAAMGRQEAALATYKKAIDQNVASARGHWKDLWAEYETERATLTDGQGSHPRALKFLDDRAKDVQNTVFFAWKYLTFDDMDGLQSMLDTKRHLTLVDQQDLEDFRRRHKDDSKKAPQFRNFRIRALAGGQVSAGPVGADVSSFEIEEIGSQGRTGTITFAAEGLAVGLKAGAIGPQSWTDFTTRAEMRIEDFDGAGRMTSAGGYLIYGGSYSVLTFFARNKPTVEVKSWGHGWGLGGGAETIVGIWTVRSVN
jgi:Domain of unknown function (DUF4157)